MGILDRLEKKRDQLRAANNLKKAGKKEGSSQISVILSPKNENGERRVKAFKPKNRYLKSYTVNDKGVGEVIFELPVGLPEVMRRLLVRQIERETEGAKEDVEVTVFVET